MVSGPSRRTTAPSDDADGAHEPLRTVGRDPPSRPLVEPLGPVRPLAGAPAGDRRDDPHARSGHRVPPRGVGLRRGQPGCRARRDPRPAPRLRVPRRRPGALGQRDPEPLADRPHASGVRSRLRTSRTSCAPSSSPRSRARADPSRCSAPTSTGGSITARRGWSRCERSPLSSRSAGPGPSHRSSPGT